MTTGAMTTTTLIKKQKVIKIRKTTKESKIKKNAA